MSKVSIEIDLTFQEKYLLAGVEETVRKLKRLHDKSNKFSGRIREKDILHFFKVYRLIEIEKQSLERVAKKIYKGDVDA